MRSEGAALERAHFAANERRAEVLGNAADVGGHDGHVESRVDRVQVHDHGLRLGNERFRGQGSGGWKLALVPDNQVVDREERSDRARNNQTHGLEPRLGLRCDRRLRTGGYRQLQKTNRLHAGRNRLAV